MERYQPLSHFLEDFMTARNFAAPVSVLVGLGFPYDVETPWQACQLLSEWSGSRGPAHSLALTLCRDASIGTGDPEAARLAFETFARKTGILAAEQPASAAAVTARSALPA